MEQSVRCDTIHRYGAEHAAAVGEEVFGLLT
jgi:hypothetical protein